MKRVNEKKVERVKQALSLRRRGYTYQEIADAMSVSLQSVHAWIKAALESLKEDYKAEAHALMEVELSRLDLYLTKLRPRIDNGEPKAIAEARRISESRRKLLGLDRAVPVPVVVESSDGGQLVRDLLEKIKGENPQGTDPAGDSSVKP